MEPRRAHLLELSVRRGRLGGTTAAATARGPRPTVTVRGAGAARRREPCGAQCGPCAHRPRFLVRRRNPPRSRHRGCADAGELVLDPEAPQARMPDTRALPPRAAWSPHTVPGRWADILPRGGKWQSTSSYRLPRKHRLRAPPCPTGWAAAAQEEGTARPLCTESLGTEPLALRTPGRRFTDKGQGNASERRQPVRLPHPGHSDPEPEPHPPSRSWPLITARLQIGSNPSRGDSGRAGHGVFYSENPETVTQDGQESASPAP